jgi:2,3-bisphosphoglycerate-independent phosphoglycerate mutase
MSNKKPTLLIIIDGLGYSKNSQYNALYQAKPLTFTYFLNHYPHTLLKASGTAVGLLDSMIGNSEVGHLTIGAGKVIDQPVKKICSSIEDGSLYKNDMLRSSFKEIAETDHTVHFMGLLSDAGVHSYNKHLYAFIDIAIASGVTSIVIHPFLDGRDVPPRSAHTYLQDLENEVIKKYPQYVTIGSIHGRFYAMDRDNNWSRTQKSYAVLTDPEHDYTRMSHNDVLSHMYNEDITDEFVTPTRLKQNAYITSGDGVFFFNFRPDRARQLTQLLLNNKDKGSLPIAWLITLTSYGKDYPTRVLMYNNYTHTTLYDVLEENDKTMFTIAETEKYAHVTYFFNGGRESKRDSETRIIIPSVTQRTYVDYPQMSAEEITDKVIESLCNNQKDFYLINYANPDMVGHAGDMNATIKAIQCVDKQLKRLYDCAVKTYKGTMYITSDHGNAEQQYDAESKQPHTAHTTNPVYFIHVSPDMYRADVSLSKLTELKDIAPYIIKDMHLAT